MLYAHVRPTTETARGMEFFVCASVGGRDDAVRCRCRRQRRRRSDVARVYFGRSARSSARVQLLEFKLGVEYYVIILLLFGLLDRRAPHRHCLCWRCTRSYKKHSFFGAHQHKHTHTPALTPQEGRELPQQFCPASWGGAFSVRLHEHRETQFVPLSPLSSTME